MRKGFAGKAKKVLERTGEAAIVNVSRLHSRLFVTVTVIVTALVSGVPQSSADVNVVVFSETSELVSNISYDPVGELGIDPDPPGGRTIRHLVIGLRQGEYSVRYGGDDVVCSEPPYYCFSPENAPPGVQAPSSLEFTSCLPVIGDGRMFEITRIGDIDLPDPPVIVQPVSNNQHYASLPAEVLVSGTCEADIEFLTIEVNGKNPITPILQTSPEQWSYTYTLTERHNTISVTASRDGLTSEPAIIYVTYTSIPGLPLEILNNGGEDFFTNDPSVTLAGTCDSMTSTITVDLTNASGSSSSSEDHIVGITSWSYTDGGGVEIAPSEAFAFQDEGTLAADVLSSVTGPGHVNRWSPTYTVPTGTVIADIYATGPALEAFDALSLKFPADDLNLSDLTLRVYLQKGTYQTVWEHYELLPGIFNPEDEDVYYHVYTPADSRDHLPNGELAPGTTVGWIDMPFDATSDPLFDEPGGDIGVTLRMWNWRVDAVRLAERSVLLREGENHFTVTGEDISEIESTDEIVITLDVQAPEIVITSDGGNGPGNDFTILGRTATIGGTFQDDWVVAAVEVNGTVEGVSFAADSGTWTHDAELNVGRNTLVVTVRDAAGNVSPADSVTITFDHTHGTPATSWLGNLVLYVAIIVSVMIGRMGRKVRSAR